MIYNENINSWRVQVLQSSNDFVRETYNTTDATERSHTFTYADIGVLGTYKLELQHLLVLDLIILLLLQIDTFVIETTNSYCTNRYYFYQY